MRHDDAPARESSDWTPPARKTAARGKVTKTRKTHHFRKGDEFSLDSIFEIQGLGGGDWWEKIPDGGGDVDMSEACRCTRDIKIVVVVETPNY